MKLLRNTVIRAGLDALYFSGAHYLLRPIFAGVGVIFMLHHVRPRRDYAFRPNCHLEVEPEFLRAVLAQRLLPDLQGGRVALYELLVNTAAAANLIREGKTWQLPGIIQTGQQAGMQNFDQSLAERRAQGRL